MTFSTVAQGTSAGTMPWGKHRGKPLSEVPRDYLDWAVHNADAMKPELRAEIEAVLGLPIGSTSPPPNNPGDVKLSDIKGNRSLSDEDKNLVKQMKTAWGKDQARLRELEKENLELRAQLTMQERNQMSDMDVFRRIVKQAFAAMSRRFHPDLGGSQEKQTVVNLCFCDLLSRLETQ